MYAMHDGVVGKGFQFASGEAVGRGRNPSPFPDATLKLQDQCLRDRGFDLAREVPGLFWGTVNVRLDQNVVLRVADYTFPHLNWLEGSLADGSSISPETFSFVRCCLAYDGRYYPGLVYYPHPETKPATNRHDHAVLEVITSRVGGLAYGRSASVICRAEAFSRS